MNIQNKLFKPGPDWIERGQSNAVPIRPLREATITRVVIPGSSTVSQTQQAQPVLKPLKS